MPIQVAVEARNAANVSQTRHLELYVDGTKESVSPTFTIEPGGTARYEFRFTPDRAGVHKGEVRFAEEDASSMDDRLYFAATVDQQVPVALLKPRRNAIEFAEDGFYLERALAPGGPGVGALRVTSLTPEEVKPETLNGFAVVFGVNLPALPRSLPRNWRGMSTTAGASSGFAAPTSRQALTTWRIPTRRGHFSRRGCPTRACLLPAATERSRSAGSTPTIPPSRR